jgi:uncharacterized protein YdiU (UPF0061 family)
VVSDEPIFAFDNSYARLPERFFARVAPTPVAGPELIRVNRPLAADLGLNAEYLASPEGVAILAGNRVPENATPLAMAYAGYQFGGWVPQLGDGRAILLGELIDRAGERRDLQLKGAGPTPFSRGGDGRAGLGPVLREYVVSEAMAALGVPTTRALAAVTTGQPIMRETPQPGAVLARVARSHVRVGTFQFFAGRQDTEAIRTLADYLIARHDPALVDTARPYGALLGMVIERQAELIAQWQSIGFIHGVMNTDNMSVVGETIDYGPCAFMDGYHPATVYSSIDRHGRYAFGNQPTIAHWNLARLAEAMLPILGPDGEAAVEEATARLGAFPGHFERCQRARMRAKLGLRDHSDGADDASDDTLVADLLARMAEHGADFTLTFRRLSDAVDQTPAGDDSVAALFADPGAFEAWAIPRTAIRGMSIEARAAWRNIRPGWELDAMLFARPISAPPRRRAPSFVWPEVAGFPPSRERRRDLAERPWGWMRASTATMSLRTCRGSTPRAERATRTASIARPTARMTDKAIGDADRFEHGRTYGSHC